LKTKVDAESGFAWDAPLKTKVDAESGFAWRRTSHNKGRCVIQLCWATQPARHRPPEAASGEAGGPLDVRCHFEIASKNFIEILTQKEL